MDEATAGSAGCRSQTASPVDSLRWLPAALSGMRRRALDARAALLVDEFAPLPDPAAGAITEQIGRRNDLGGLVGLGGSWRTFESVVVVAAPLLTALIGSATSA